MPGIFLSEVPGIPLGVLEYKLYVRWQGNYPLDNPGTGSTQWRPTPEVAEALRELCSRLSRNLYR